MTPRIKSHAVDEYGQIYGESYVKYNNKKKSMLLQEKKTTTESHLMTKLHGVDLTQIDLHHLMLSTRQAALQALEMCMRKVQPMQIITSAHDLEN